MKTKKNKTRRLRDWERYLIGKGMCPNCGHRGLVTETKPGHSGDDYQEVTICPKCGAEY